MKIKHIKPMTMYCVVSTNNNDILQVGDYIWLTNDGLLSKLRSDIPEWDWNNKTIQILRECEVEEAQWCEIQNDGYTVVMHFDRL